MLGTFYFSKFCQISLQGDCTNYHFHQLCMIGGTYFSIHYQNWVSFSALLFVCLRGIFIYNSLNIWVRFSHFHIYYQPCVFFFFVYLWTSVIVPFIFFLFNWFLSILFIFIYLFSHSTNIYCIPATFQACPKCWEYGSKLILHWWSLYSNE